MAVDDIWQVVATGSFLGQVITNVFWYRQNSNDISNQAGTCTDEFEATVLNNVIKLQSETMVWNKVVSTNWSTGLAQDVQSISLEGLVSDVVPPMPSFCTFSFTLPRSLPIYSSGSKRFAGVPLGYAQGNFEDIPPDDLADVLACLHANLTHSGGMVFVPVVVVGSLAGVPQNKNMANPPYTSWAINSAIFRGISTQRTRLNLLYDTP